MLNVPLPSGFAPSKNVTKPVGIPETAVTVAVNVTVSPKVIVAVDAATVVVVAPETGEAGRAGREAACAFLAAREPRARALAEAFPFVALGGAPGIAKDERAPNVERKTKRTTCFSLSICLCSWL